MLETNDGDALDALPSFEDTLAGVVDKCRLDALRDEIGEFNFNGALSTLAAQKRKLRKSTAIDGGVDEDEGDIQDNQ